MFRNIFNLLYSYSTAKSFHKLNAYDTPVQGRVKRVLFGEAIHESGSLLQSVDGGGGGGYPTI